MGNLLTLMAVFMKVVGMVAKNTVMGDSHIPMVDAGLVNIGMVHHGTEKASCMAKQGKPEMASIVVFICFHKYINCGINVPEDGKFYLKYGVKI